MIDETEKILKALADISRLRIINMLSRRNMCVCELTALTGLGQSTVSGHLKVLKDAGLATDYKDGLWVEYRLTENKGFKKKLLDVVLEVFSNDPRMLAEQEGTLSVSREKICAKN